MLKSIADSELIWIIIIISLFNVDAKSKVKNYNKKRNYSIYNKLQYIKW